MAGLASPPASSAEPGEAGHERRRGDADRRASGGAAGEVAEPIEETVTSAIAYLSASLEFIEDELKRAAGGLAEDRRAETLQALGEAREGALRIRNVVRDLKTFARVEEEHRSVLDLEEVVESTTNLALNEVRQRARVVRDYQPAPPVLASQARVSQVVLNLLINAAGQRMVLISGGAFTPGARVFLDRVKNPRLEKPFVPGQLRALVRGMVRR